MSRAIVCGVDESEESLGAATAAARIAESMGSSMVLAHVVDHPPTLPGGDEQEPERARRRGHERGRDLLERIERRIGGTPIDGRVVIGAPERILPALAAAEDAALLVVGSRGRGALKAAVLGSVSSAVVRESERPVLIVPPEAGEAAVAEAGDHAAVVCGVDGSEEAAAAAEVAARIAVALRLELVLVHAYQQRASSATIPAPGLTPPIARDLEERQRDGSRSLLEATAREVGKEGATMRVELGDASPVLDRIAVEERAQLIVVGTHGRGRLTAALLGSTSTRLAASASTPVLVVPRGASLPALNGPVGGGVRSDLGRAGR